MKPFKKFLIILSSGILSLFLVTTILFACAGGFEEEWFSSFFAPEVVAEDKYEPFFRSNMWPFYRGYKEDYNTQFDSVNVQEWYSFFDSKVSPQDLSDILYKLELKEIDTLIFYIKDNSFPASQKIKNNSLTAYSDKKTAREFLFYIGFAKRCSKHSVRDIYYWYYDEEEEEGSGAEISSLINGANKLLKYVNSSFIRQRYYFQLVRLHYFNKDYVQCADFYSARKDSFNLNRSLGYRAMAYAAGAYSKLTDFPVANYMFAQVYDQYDPMKKTAFLSFEPIHEEDLNASLTMAKSKREKCAIWHLVGLKNDPVRGMEEIYRIDPASDLMEVLLARAINITEENIVPAFGWYYRGADDDSYQLVSQNMNTGLLGFVTEVAENKNTSRPYVWYLAAGYLHTLSGNFKEADKYLSKSASLGKNDPKALDQIRIVRIVQEVMTYVPDKKNEKNITGELQWLSGVKNLRADYTYDWSKKRLAKLYFSHGDTIKALCLNPYIDENYLWNVSFLDRFIAYLDKPDKTEFDSFVAKLYPYNSKVLLDMQGVNLLYAHRFEEAGEKFAKAGDYGLESDPFSIRIRDCRDCDQAVYEGGDTKLSFVDEMLRLKQKVSEDPENAAEYYFLLGNGYYNMTYFGNCRNLYQNSAFQPGLMSFRNRDDASDPYFGIFDCSKAKDYYEIARNASSDTEFQAKCAFMAAKCEQNEYYSSQEFNEEEIIRSGKYYNMLKTQYADTDYYQEILEECGYFNTYLNQ